jgi:uncharacterized protein (DUF697 family)
MAEQSDGRTMEPREAAAMQIVYRYMAVSAGAALIPLAGLDVVTLAGVHVSLIKRLCDHYEIDFSEHAARNVLIAVFASIGPGVVGSLAGRRVLRALPAAIGPFGWALMSASSAVFSYGIGRLFIHHFEAGGTLLTFDAERLHDVFFHPRADRPTSAAPATGAVTAPAH